MFSDIIAVPQDLRHLIWSQTRRSSGTAGSFLKSYDDFRQQRRYYKLSSFDAFHGITGHECVNELIADRLLTLFGFPHLHYTLISANIIIDSTEYHTWLCRSDNFRQFGERKLALDTFYQLERSAGESPLDFCIRYGWRTYLDQMLLIDYLILNRDRHGANMEVLQNPKEKTIRLAPLFDHGISLVFSCHDERSLRPFDVMEDRPVQSFIGSRSSRENLSLISASFWDDLPELHDSDRFQILGGLELVLPEVYLDTIWNMIWRRWQSLESIRHT